MKIELNSIIDVTITRIEQYGLIVDYHGAEGLVLLPDLSWNGYGIQRKLDSGELHKVGEKVKVKVLIPDIVPFKASIKEVFPEDNPWLKIRSMDLTKPIEVKVVQKVEFGHFVEVMPGLTGVIYKSEKSRSLAEGYCVLVCLNKVDYEMRKIEFVLSS